jgi:hypothetical protein
MKEPLNEAAEMRSLVFHASLLLAEAEDIEAGRKARIILTNDAGDTRASIVSFRAARYARKVMGQPALLPEGNLHVVFSSRGITVSLRPTIEGYLAISETIIAYQCGEIRRIKRQIGKNKRRMNEGNSEQGEGGAAL